MALSIGLMSTPVPACPDGMVNCIGAMETASPQPPGIVDGWELHLPLPYHDGGDDGLQASAVALLLQGWYVGSL